MDDSIRKQLVPGAEVLVTQQLPHRDRAWTTEVRGTIISCEQRPTGSWFAHSRDHKIWLDRLLIRKADGEMTLLNLDQYTHIEILAPAGAGAGGGAAGSSPPR